MITITCILYYRLPLTDIGTLRIRGSHVFGGVYRLYNDTADKYNTYFILLYSSPRVVRTMRFSGFWFKPGFDI